MTRSDHGRAGGNDGTVVPLVRQAGTKAARRRGPLMTGRSWPVGRMADFELRREIAGGGADSAKAADELAARREERRRLRGIDPQAALIAHHCGPGRPAVAEAGRPAYLPPQDAYEIPGGRLAPPPPAVRTGLGSEAVTGSGRRE